MEREAARGRSEDGRRGIARMLLRGCDRTAPGMRKGTMNGIWRSRVMQLWLATRLKLRIATSTPSTISECSGSAELERYCLLLGELGLRYSPTGRAGASRKDLTHDTAILTGADVGHSANAGHKR